MCRGVPREQAVHRYHRAVCLRQCHLKHLTRSFPILARIGEGKRTLLAGTGRRLDTSSNRSRPPRRERGRGQPALLGHRCAFPRGRQLVPWCRGKGIMHGRLIVKTFYTTICVLSHASARFRLQSWQDYSDKQRRSRQVRQGFLSALCRHGKC